MKTVIKLACPRQAAPALQVATTAISWDQHTHVTHAAQLQTAASCTLACAASSAPSGNPSHSTAQPGSHRRCSLCLRQWTALMFLPSCCTLGCCRSTAQQIHCKPCQQPPVPQSAPQHCQTLLPQRPLGNMQQGPQNSAALPPCHTLQLQALH
jgi:hypothetical protein